MSTGRMKRTYPDPGPDGRTALPVYRKRTSAVISPERTARLAARDATATAVKALVGRTVFVTMTVMSREGETFHDVFSTLEDAKASFDKPGKVLKWKREPHGLWRVESGVFEDFEVRKVRVR